MWNIVAIAVLCLALLVVASHYMWANAAVIAALFATPLIYYALVNVYAHWFVFAPIRDARKHLTFADFQREFEGGNFSNRVLEIAYLELTTLVGFPIVRSDHLWKTLHLDRHDVEDSLEERLKGLGISEVSSMVRVDTVEDYVRFWSHVLGTEHGKNCKIAAVAERNGHSPHQSTAEEG